MGVTRGILEPFGRVAIYTLGSARCVSARWIEHGQVLKVSAPTFLSHAEIISSLRNMEPRIMALRQEALSTGVKYYDGFEFHTDDWGFVVKLGPAPAGVDVRSLMTPTPLHFIVQVNDRRSIEEYEMQKAIKTIIERLAFLVGKNELIPRAIEIAKSLNLPKPPTAIRMSKSLRHYGICRGNGVINLSHLLMFQPFELRRATIVHELAHLTHMDHSPRFYALWDQYLGYPHTRVLALRKQITLPV